MKKNKFVVIAGGLGLSLFVALMLVARPTPAFASTLESASVANLSVTSVTSDQITVSGTMEITLKDGNSVVCSAPFVSAGAYYYGAELTTEYPFGFTPTFPGCPTPEGNSYAYTFSFTDNSNVGALGAGARSITVCPFSSAAATANNLSQSCASASFTIPAPAAGSYTYKPMGLSFGIDYATSTQAITLSGSVAVGNENFNTYGGGCSGTPVGEYNVNGPVDPSTASWSIVDASGQTDMSGNSLFGTFSQQGSTDKNYQFPCSVQSLATTYNISSGTSLNVSSLAPGTYAFNIIVSPAACEASYPDTFCAVLAPTSTWSGSFTIPVPAPAVTLTALPPTISLGNSTGLTWTSTNATSCSASGSNDGGWNGSRATNGSMLPEQPGATGTATFMITCKGPGGSGSASASVNVIAGPTSNVGTITMNSENSVIQNLGVPAQWDILDGASDICTTPTDCQGTSGTYLNQPAVGDASTSSAGSIDVPTSSVALLDNNEQYSLNSMQLAPAKEQHVGVIDEMLALTKSMFVSTAEAWTVPLTNPLAQTLNPGKSTSFIILWDPIADIGVNTNSVSLSAPLGGSTSGQVQVSNTGAPGSTLTWVSSITYANGSGWLSISPSTDSSGLTNGASGNASEPISLIPSSTLPVGTYNATVTLKLESSTPGFNQNDLHPTVSFTVTFTVTSSGGGGGHPTGVTATCNPSSVNTNATSTCTAVVSGTGTYSTAVTWSTNNGTIGSNTGNYKAPATVGNATATACSTQPGYTNVCGSTPITITSSGSVPVCTSFSASPSSIVIPESSNLSYACSPVTQCQITGGGTTFPPGGGTGSVSVTPTTTTTYTLTCVNGPGGTPVSTTTPVTVGGSAFCEQNPNGAGCPGQ